jgi:hypothetical protein
MNLQSSHDIVYFVLFFIPGFIMLKIYGMLVATDKFDFSSGLLEAVAFSCINYALCSPIILMAIKNDWFIINFSLFFVSIILIILVIPIVLVLLYVNILKSEWAAKNKMLDVHKSSWDFVFSKGQSNWVIVTLKSGNKIGGKYRVGSFASSHPNKDIYLSEVWKLKAKTFEFERVVDRTSGMLILEGEILSIEFFN